jgi:hypothetical protein
MRRWSSLVLGAALSALLLCGCQSHGAGVSVQSPATSPQSAGSTSTSPATFSAQTLADAFSVAGFRTRIQPGQADGIFGSAVDWQILSVGNERLELFVFSSASVLERAVARVAADGSAIPQIKANGSIGGVAMVEWKGRPHLFARGRVLALFVESGPRTTGQSLSPGDVRVIEILTRSMGPQFAGS